MEIGKKGLAQQGMDGEEKRIEKRNEENEKRKD